MSVKLSLEAIFSDLYSDRDPELKAGTATITKDTDAGGAGPGADAKDDVAVAAGDINGVDGTGHAEGDADSGQGSAAPQMPLAETQSDPYEEAIDRIRGSLASTLQGTQLVATHLVQARHDAAGKDEASVLAKDYAYGREHRKTGVPVEGSKLNLSDDLISQHGLLHPGRLMSSVQQAQMASMREGDSIDLNAAEAAARPQPNYMNQTKSFEMQTTESPLTASIKSIRTLRESARASEKRFAGIGQGTKPLDAIVRSPGHSPSPSPQPQAPPPRKQLKPNPAVAAEESRLMQKVQAPLNFTRNPRFVKTARAPAESAYSQQPAVATNDMFIHMTPQEVVFTDYAPGGLYEIPVRLKNVSSVSRRVRILPPTSRYFSASLVAYPSDEGHLAPGLSAEFKARFAPDSLADYSDFLIVQTEKESFPLPLRARRAPPVLTLPAVLDVGYCFFGASRSVDFSAINKGGVGRFIIMDKARWESNDREPVSPVKSGPFTITPTFLDVAQGDDFSILVSFTPTRIGQHETSVLLICDNCQMKELLIRGNCCAASVQIESVDERAPVMEGAGGKAIQELVDFGAVSVYGRAASTVRLLNTTPIALKFEWAGFGLNETKLPLTRLRNAAGGTGVVRTSELGAPVRMATPTFPFTISPASGTIAAGEGADFEVSYLPSATELATGALLFSPMDVPPQSMPGAEEQSDGDGGDGGGGGAKELVLRVLGRGVGSDLSIFPAVVNALAGVPLGSEFNLELTLTNPNSSSRAWRWQPEEPTVEGDKLSVVVEPSDGEIEAEADAKIRLAMRGDVPGTLRRTLRFDVSPHGRELRLPVALQVLGPHLVASSARVDFGLCPLGEAATAPLTLTNESDTEAAWMLLPAATPKTKEAQDAVRAQAEALGRETPSAPTVDELGWAWSSSSDLDSASRLKVEEQLAAVHLAAGLSIDHLCGVVPPRGHTSLVLTADVAAAQSLRRSLALHVRHGQTQFVNLTSEVIARRACLSTSHIDLGVSYVKVPVQRRFELRNLTRIPTDFKFAPRAVNQPSSIDLELEPNCGTLKPGGSISIVMHFLARAVCDVDMLVGCELHHGTAAPVALRVSSIVKGLTLSYEVAPIDDPRVMQPPPPTEPHVPPPQAPLPALEFGLDVPIFEQRGLLLLIQNHSAVPTQYEVEVSTYGAPELSGELAEPPNAHSFALSDSMVTAVKAAETLAKRQAARTARLQAELLSSRASGFTSPPQSVSGRSRVSNARSVASSLGAVKPVLGDAHERAQPFFSESGVNYSAQQTLKRREAALLSSRRGAAFELTPCKGELEPWATALVVVRAHSNMWGLYEDTLVCRVEGLAPVSLPLRLGVVGNPIKLHDATLGLSLRTSPPLIAWPPLLVEQSAQAKTVRLTNHGPEPVELRWALLHAPDALAPTTSVLRASGDGVQLRVTTAERRPLPTGDGAVFAVEPAQATIPIAGERSFRVSFSSAVAGHYSGRLVAMLTHPHAISKPNGGKTDRHPNLELQLSADTIVPELQVSEREKLKFKVSPVHPKEHSSYTRSLTLRNATSTTLRFSLGVAAPFVLQDVTASASQHGLLGQRQVNETSELMLPARESVQATISYVPDRRRSRSSAQSDCSDGEDGARSDAGSVRSTATTMRTAQSAATAVVARMAPPDASHAYLSHQTSVHGTLRIRFHNGSEQTFPLIAAITAPFIELSTHSITFDPCHVKSSRSFEMAISNPSEAECHWTLKHVPPPPPPPLTASRRKTEAAAATAAEAADKPEVFIFGQMSGMLPPRQGHTPQKATLSVRFVPDIPGKYHSVFVFKVKKGAAARLEISAEATLLEEHYDVNATEQHLRMMRPGTLS